MASDVPSSAHPKNFWEVSIMEDPIVAEVRKTRDRLAAKFNYDIDAILRDAKKREAESGHEIVGLEPRKPKAIRGRHAKNGRKKRTRSTLIPHASSQRIVG
jgi:hypothetical protein